MTLAQQLTPPASEAGPLFVAVNAAASLSATLMLRILKGVSEGLVKVTVCRALVCRTFTLPKLRDVGESSATLPYRREQPSAGCPARYS